MSTYVEFQLVINNDDSYIIDDMQARNIVLKNTELQLDWSTYIYTKYMRHMDVHMEREDYAGCMCLEFKLAKLKFNCSFRSYIIPISIFEKTLAELKLKYLLSDYTSRDGTFPEALFDPICVRQRIEALGNSKNYVI